MNTPDEPNDVPTSEDPIIPTEIQSDAPLDTPVTTEADNRLYLFLETISQTELVALINARRKVIGEDEFEINAARSGSYENLLALAYNDHSAESDRARAAITDIADKSLFAEKLERDGKVILAGTRTARGPSGKGKMVSGAAARIEFARRAGHLKRIPLYNSGFSLDVDAPGLEALNRFFNRAHDDNNQYGRQFGSHFYYFNDLLIKEAAIELMTSHIVSSNLRGWNRGPTLLKSIKLSEYKVIMNSLAAMMFPDGFKFTHICANPAGTCSHSDELLIDVNKLLRHNFMRLSDAAIAHMAKGDEIGQDDLIRYHTEIDITRKIRLGLYELELKHPSLSDYLDYGKTFNAEILKNTFAANNADIMRNLIFSYYKIYTPFIAQITLYDEAGAADLVTTDQETISHLLMRIQADDTTQVFVTELTRYIADTEISQICYPSTPCPVCGHQDPSGYHTVDPEHAFFIMCLMKLNPM